MNKKIIIIGSDHNGTSQKKLIIKSLKKNFTVIDIGNYDENYKIDYNVVASQLGNIMNVDISKFKGILLCGTGVGVNIVVNKFSSIRSVLAHSILVAKKSREHNDTNVICLGTWVNDVKTNLKIIENWLGTSFGYDRHVKRISKINSDFGLKYNVAFLNGVFDILHPGHLDLINFAKDISKKVIIGINSDKSTKKIKGNKRPINNEENRKQTLLNLANVDEVIIFKEVTPSKLIKMVKPDLIVRGDDYKENLVRKRDNINKNIDIKILKKTKNYSTTKLINLIKKN